MPPRGVRADRRDVSDVLSRRDEQRDRRRCELRGTRAQRGRASGAPSKPSSRRTPGVRWRSWSSTTIGRTNRCGGCRNRGRCGFSHRRRARRRSRAEHGHSRRPLSDHLSGRPGRRDRTGMAGPRCWPRSTIRMSPRFRATTSRMRRLGCQGDGPGPGTALRCDRWIIHGSRLHRQRGLSRGALHRVGLFDEQLGYGYDNDMSYRLRAAGHRLQLS